MSHHILDRSVYADTPMGAAAISVLGDEPAHELFMLLFQLLQVGMAGKVSFELNGERILMDLPTEPLFFEKPYYPRTIEIVNKLAKKRYLSFYGENEHGISYTLNVPAQDKRVAWIESVMNEILGAQ
jgi:hypothetical protein